MTPLLSGMPDFLRVLGGGTTCWGGGSTAIPSPQTPQTGMPSEGEDEVGEDIPLEDDDIDSEGHTSGGHAGYK